jgi:hypothetical protein
VFSICCGRRVEAEYAHRRTIWNEIWASLGTPLPSFLLGSPN